MHLYIRIYNAKGSPLLFPELMAQVGRHTLYDGLFFESGLGDFWGFLHLASGNLSLFFARK